MPFEDGRSAANRRNFALFVLISQLDDKLITVLSSDHWDFTLFFWRLILREDFHDFAILHFDLGDNLVDN